MFLDKEVKHSHDHYWSLNIFFLLHVFEVPKYQSFLKRRNHNNCHRHFKHIMSSESDMLYTYLEYFLLGPSLLSVLFWEELLQATKTNDILTCYLQLQTFFLLLTCLYIWGHTCPTAYISENSCNSWHHPWAFQGRKSLKQQPVPKQEITTVCAQMWTDQMKARPAA